jgi:hypothetical protein
VRNALQGFRGVEKLYASRVVTGTKGRNRGAAKDGGTLAMPSRPVNRILPTLLLEDRVSCRSLTDLERQVGHKLFQRFVLEEIYGGEFPRRVDVNQHHILPYVKSLRFRRTERPDSQMIQLNQRLKGQSLSVTLPTDWTISVHYYEPRSKMRL